MCRLPKVGGYSHNSLKTCKCSYCINANKGRSQPTKRVKSHDLISRQNNRNNTYARSSFQKISEIERQSVIFGRKIKKQATSYERASFKKRLFENNQSICQEKAAFHRYRLAENKSHEDFRTASLTADNGAVHSPERDTENVGYTTPVTAVWRNQHLPAVNQPSSSTGAARASRMRTKPKHRALGVKAERRRQHAHKDLKILKRKFETNPFERVTANISPTQRCYQRGDNMMCKERKEQRQGDSGAIQTRMRRRRTRADREALHVRTGDTHRHSQNRTLKILQRDFETSSFHRVTAQTSPTQRCYHKRDNVRFKGKREQKQDDSDTAETRRRSRRPPAALRELNVETVNTNRHSQNGTLKIVLSELGTSSFHRVTAQTPPTRKCYHKRRNIMLGEKKGRKETLLREQRRSVRAETAYSRCSSAVGLQLAELNQISAVTWTTSSGVESNGRICRAANLSRASMTGKDRSKTHRPSCRAEGSRGTHKENGAPFPTPPPP